MWLLGIDTSRPSRTNLLRTSVASSVGPTGLAGAARPPASPPIRAARCGPRRGGERLLQKHERAVARPLDQPGVLEAGQGPSDGRGANSER